MSLFPSLDSLVETSVFIPYAGPSDANHTLDVPLPAPSELSHRDLPDGPRLRLKAYEEAWSRCLERIQDIMHDLHAPIAARVVRAVQEAYSAPDPLLPFTELPVLAISGSDRAAMEVLFDDVRRALRAGDGDGDGDDEGDEGGDAMSEDGAAGHPQLAFAVSLAHSDCANIMQAMKAVVTGFADQVPDDAEAQPKRKPSTSLAAYDINLLHAWFKAVRAFRGGRDVPRLVVFLRDFEQFDPAVVQDLFYICSLQIPRLPLVFILALSSPPHPSYLHSAYPRSTLALLQLHRFTLVGGPVALETVLLKTFFDVDFEPHVSLGPVALDFVVEEFTRHNMTLDFLTSILQLMHLHHFMEPLTVLALDDLLGTVSMSEAAAKLQASSSRAFLDALISRVHHPERQRDDDDPDALKGERERADGKGWRVTDALSVLSLVGNARAGHMRRVRRARVAFGVFRAVQAYLVRQGYASADLGRTVFAMMGACVRGTLGRKDAGYVVRMVRKLRLGQLRALLEELHRFFHGQSQAVRQLEEAARVKLLEWMARLQSHVREDAEEGDVATIAGAVGDWMGQYFSTRMTGYAEANLWDVWYMGQASVIAELMNPSPRATIITGLMHPERYLQYGSDCMNGTEASFVTPDISILFQGYLESGRLINVYDWFQSFAGALEAEKEQQGATGGEVGEEDTDDDRGAKSPVTKKRKGKMKDAAGPVGLGKGQEEAAGAAVLAQARFIRAIHELDFMGFIKHTGRRADHVAKTVFDGPDF